LPRPRAVFTGKVVEKRVKENTRSIRSLAARLDELGKHVHDFIVEPHAIVQRAHVVLGKRGSDDGFVFAATVELCNNLIFLDCQWRR